MDNSADQQSDRSMNEAISQARNLKPATTISEVTNLATDYRRQVISTTRAKPLQTLAVAAMIGFALGAVWKA